MTHVQHGAAWPPSPVHDNDNVQPRVWFPISPPCAAGLLFWLSMWPNWTSKTTKTLKSHGLSYSLLMNLLCWSHPFFGGLQDTFAAIAITWWSSASVKQLEDTKGQTCFMFISFISTLWKSDMASWTIIAFSSMIFPANYSICVYIYIYITSSLQNLQTPRSPTPK